MKRLQFAETSSIDLEASALFDQLVADPKKERTAKLLKRQRILGRELAALTEVGKDKLPS